MRGGAAVRGRILPRPREELLALPGVGEKTADRILSYRDTYGRFSAVEQLLDVEGIGPTLLEQLRGLVTVDQTEG